MSLDTLLHLLHALSEVHSVIAGSRPPLPSGASALQRVISDGAALPSGSSVSLLWAPERLSSSDGYAPAFAQEALLLLSWATGWLPSLLSTLLLSALGFPNLRARHHSCRASRCACGGPVRSAATPSTRPSFRLHSAAIRAALRALDAVDLSERLSRKVLVLQPPPPFAKGQLRLALGLALEASEHAGHDAVALSRAPTLTKVVPRATLNVD